MMFLETVILLHNSKSTYASAFAAVAAAVLVMVVFTPAAVAVTVCIKT